MRVAAGALLCLLGCGGGGGARDGGLPDGSADGGSASAPQIPWLREDGTVALEIAPPVLLPCPDGWREAGMESGVAHCEPYPEAGVASCGAGEAHFPGEAGCAPVGRACPAGDFADGLADDGTVLFVLAGAPAGGDGSRGAPLSSIGAAVGRATTGMVIAVGRGRYDELVTLRGGVTLAGACSAATAIVFAGADPRPAVLTATASATVRDVTIGPSDRIGITARGASTELTLEGVVVEAVTTSGLLVHDQARLTAHRLVVRRTAPDAFGEFGRGLGVEGGGRVELHRVILEQNHDSGIGVIDAGSSLLLTDIVVRDTRSLAIDGTGGAGITVQTGATVEVNRGLFEGNRGRGLSVIDPGASVALEDVIVRGTRSEEADLTTGYGLHVTDGAAARLTRSLVEGNRAGGVAIDTGASTMLADVIVRDTLTRESDHLQGGGLVVVTDSSAELGRVLVQGNRGSGMYVGPGSTLMAADLVVRDTLSLEGDLSFGHGLDVAAGARVEVQRALFERNREVGVYAGAEGATVVLTDVVVRETDTRESTGGFGRAVSLSAGASIEVSRALFEDNREVAVIALGELAGATLTDVVVRDTRPNGDGNGGIAAGSYGGASLTLRRFLLTGSASAGVQLARGGTVDLHEGEISGNAIGVNVQVEGFDLGRLMDRVVYRDNGQDLVSDALPVPESTLPIGR